MQNKIMTASLLEILSYRAQYQPDKQAYIFLQNGETESGSLTYGELDKQARAIASYLQSWQGERAVLLYPSGLEFITAFFGCLYAGVVAVPVYPPKRNQKLYRLLSIINDAQAQVALTTTSILADTEKRYEEEALTQLKWVATDTIEANPQEFIHKSVTPESLAFLQYTSGSIGTPKGVMVTHGNIIHNQQMIAQAFGHSEKSIYVCWLPLFHDMGLIGNVLQAMYLGIPCILMPPVAFLQKPIRWLEAISKYRATTSGAPNFAYDLCVKEVQPEQLANLDLSSWDLAFNGSEPVRAETLGQFGQKFAGCGFNYRAFYPCYGMAENTLMTTGGDKNQLPVIQRVLAKSLEQNLIVESEISSQVSRVVVGCGRSYMDITAIIVNPESLTRCEKGQVGEIWVSGESVASGYWNRPEATQETFQAYLKDTGEGPFLRTGDWGFFSNEELFVTGRLKDTIIIRGRNHYPQDIEVTVERSHPALRSVCAAAFAVEVEGEERLVVAQEVERSYLRNLNGDEVIGAIRKAVSQGHELEVYAVLLLKTGSIPKTSSGKIQRHACRTGFLTGSLTVVGSSILDYNNDFKGNTTTQETSTVIDPLWSQQLLELNLRNLISRFLGIAPSQINKQQPLNTLSLDSLQAVRIKREIEVNFNLVLPAETFLEDISLTQLAARLFSQLTLPSSSSPITSAASVQTLAQFCSSKKRCRLDKTESSQSQVAKKSIEFSLFYFSSNEAEFTNDKYQLLIEGAKFADQHGFTAVWVPERHFHAFGGLYPNPSVLGSALAMVTKQIRIRAGSVVLPLQNPIRVAEEWAVVDNLSQGRVDIAFARGWNPNDFVLSPDNFFNNKEVMFSSIKTVQKLWQGESIFLCNGVGKETEIRIYPLPKQQKIPIWISCTGGKERFIEAGVIGANVLTALLFQSIEELAEKIALYRQSRAEHGHDPNTGHVTLMLHTFIAEDINFVRSKVRKPFTNYLKSSVNLWQHEIKNLDDLDDEEKEYLLAYAFERYFQNSALMGTPRTCLQMVKKLREVGVNEIACLIDFGIDTDSVIDSFYFLEKLKEQSELMSGLTQADFPNQALTVEEKTPPPNLQTRSRFYKGNWIIDPQQKPDAQLRLFCLPYAAGSTTAFRHWSNDLLPEIEVYAIEAKNLTPRIKPPFEHLACLVKDLAEFLLPYLDKAFAFYGHSLGALINFELSRYLRQAYNLKPIHFFVGAQHAPHFPYPYPAINELTDSQLSELISDLTDIKLPERVTKDVAFSQSFIESLRTGSAFQNENYTYTEEEPLTCPITAFGGMQDKFLSKESLLAWQVHTNSSFKLQMFSGNHLFLTSHKEQLLQALSQELSLYIIPKGETLDEI